MSTLSTLDVSSISVNSTRAPHTERINPTNSPNFRIGTNRIYNTTPRCSNERASNPERRSSEVKPVLYNLTKFIEALRKRREQLESNLEALIKSEITTPLYGRPCFKEKTTYLFELEIKKFFLNGELLLKEFVQSNKNDISESEWKENEMKFMEARNELLLLAESINVHLKGRIELISCCIGETEELSGLKSMHENFLKFKETIEKKLPLFEFNFERDKRLPPKDRTALIVYAEIKEKITQHLALNQKELKELRTELMRNKKLIRIEEIKENSKKYLPSVTKAEEMLTKVEEKLHEDLQSMEEDLYFLKLRNTGGLIDLGINSIEEKIESFREKLAHTQAKSEQRKLNLKLNSLQKRLTLGTKRRRAQLPELQYQFGFLHSKLKELSQKNGEDFKKLQELYKKLAGFSNYNFTQGVLSQREMTQNEFAEEIERLEALGEKTKLLREQFKGRYPTEFKILSEIQQNLENFKAKVKELKEIESIKEEARLIGFQAGKLRMGTQAITEWQQKLRNSEESLLQLKKRTNLVLTRWEEIGKHTKRFFKTLGKALIWLPREVFQIGAGLHMLIKRKIRNPFSNFKTLSEKLNDRIEAFQWKLETMETYQDFWRKSNLLKREEATLIGFLRGLNKEVANREDERERYGDKRSVLQKLVLLGSNGLRLGGRGPFLKSNGLVLETKREEALHPLGIAHYQRNLTLYKFLREKLEPRLDWITFLTSRQQNLLENKENYTQLFQDEQNLHEKTQREIYAKEVKEFFERTARDKLNRASLPNSENPMIKWGHFATEKRNMNSELEKLTKNIQDLVKKIARHKRILEKIMEAEEKLKNATEEQKNKLSMYIYTLKKHKSRSENIIKKLQASLDSVLKEKKQVIRAESQYMLTLVLRDPEDKKRFETILNKRLAQLSALHINFPVEEVASSLLHDFVPRAVKATGTALRITRLTPVERKYFIEKQTEVEREHIFNFFKYFETEISEEDKEALIKMVWKGKEEERPCVRNVLDVVGEILSRLERPSDKPSADQLEIALASYSKPPRLHIFPDQNKGKFSLIFEKIGCVLKEIPFKSRSDEQPITIQEYEQPITVREHSFSSSKLRISTILNREEFNKNKKEFKKACKKIHSDKLALWSSRYHFVPFAQCSAPENCDPSRIIEARTEEFFKPVSGLFGRLQREIYNPYMGEILRLAQLSKEEYGKLCIHQDDKLSVSYKEIKETAEEMQTTLSNVLFSIGFKFQELLLESEYRKNGLPDDRKEFYSFIERHEILFGLLDKKDKNNAPKFSLINLAQTRSDLDTKKKLYESNEKDYESLSQRLTLMQEKIDYMAKVLQNEVFLEKDIELFYALWLFSERNRQQQDNQQLLQQQDNKPPRQKLEELSLIELSRVKKSLMRLKSLKYDSVFAAKMRKVLSKREYKIKIPKIGLEAVESFLEEVKRLAAERRNTQWQQSQQQQQQQQINVSHEPTITTLTNPEEITSRNTLAQLNGDSTDLNTSNQHAPMNLPRRNNTVVSSEFRLTNGGLEPHDNSMPSYRYRVSVLEEKEDYDFDNEEERDYDSNIVNLNSSNRGAHQNISRANSLLELDEDITCMNEVD